MVAGRRSVTRLHGSRNLIQYPGRNCCIPEFAHIASLGRRLPEKGEGAEMLQPLAISIVSGLIFSMFVTLLLVPIIYNLAHTGD